METVYVQRGYKSKLHSGHACCCLFQNLLSSHLQSKNISAKIYRTALLPVLSYGCEAWSVTLRGEYMLRVE